MVLKTKYWKNVYNAKKKSCYSYTNIRKKRSITRGNKYVIKIEESIFQIVNKDKYMLLITQPQKKQKLTDSKEKNDVPQLDWKI